MNEPKTAREALNIMSDQNATEAEKWKALAIVFREAILSEGGDLDYDFSKDKS